MTFILVGIAGMFGALLRYSLSAAIDGSAAEGAFPAATFCANIAGAFILGWFTTYVIAARRLHPQLSAAIGTGLIGSFTTFSTFSVETVELLRGGHWALALLYGLASMVGGLLAAALGCLLGKRLVRRREGAE
ncbi:MAG TPA: fluoride efflux transporter CrcB [Bacillales bacterium]|nr:fluoride efflux transporter CrcB [Bacillales bacterium]